MAVAKEAPHIQQSAARRGGEGTDELHGGGASAHTVEVVVGAGGSGVIQIITHPREVPGAGEAAAGGAGGRRVVKQHRRRGRAHVQRVQIEGVDVSVAASDIRHAEFIKHEGIERHRAERAELRELRIGRIHLKHECRARRTEGEAVELSDG